MSTLARRFPAIVLAIFLSACTDGTPDSRSRVTKNTPSAPAASDEWRLQPADDGSWIAAFFLPKTGDPCGIDETPQRRWYRIAETGINPSGEAGLRESLARVREAQVHGLTNPLSSLTLNLQSARDDAGTLTLDFSSDSDLESNGSCDAAADRSMFDATVRHYFPNVRRQCITIGGKSDTVVFHDEDPCPDSEP